MGSEDRTDGRRLDLGYIEENPPTGWHVVPGCICSGARIITAYARKNSKQFSDVLPVPEFARFYRIDGEKGDVYMAISVEMPDDWLEIEDGAEYVSFSGQK